ncbi:MAG TPA: hypothetical protein DCZ91_04225 [Lachnospiraceae bacterium]|nr:hypothetical protein [Lachnospiraceae bacterium]
MYAASFLNNPIVTSAKPKYKEIMLFCCFREVIIYAKRISLLANALHFQYNKSVGRIRLPHLRRGAGDLAKSADAVRILIQEEHTVTP